MQRSRGEFMKTAEEWFIVFSEQGTRGELKQLSDSEFWNLVCKQIQLDAMKEGMRRERLPLTHPTIHSDYYKWLKTAKENDFWKSKCDFQTFHSIAMWVWTESRQEANKTILTASEQLTEKDL